MGRNSSIRSMHLINIQPLITESNHYENFFCQIPSRLYLAIMRCPADLSAAEPLWAGSVLLVAGLDNLNEIRGQTAAVQDGGHDDGASGAPCVVLVPNTDHQVGIREHVLVVLKKKRIRIFKKKLITIHYPVVKNTFYAAFVAFSWLISWPWKGGSHWNRRRNGFLLVDINSSVVAS